MTSWDQMKGAHSAHHLCRQGGSPPGPVCLQRTGLSRCLLEVVGRALGVPQLGSLHGRRVQEPSIPACPVSTPLNHRGKAPPPGQGPEHNLAWHQKEKLLAVASPAKEIPGGLIFMCCNFQKKQATLIPGRKPWTFSDVSVQGRQQGEESLRV